MISPITKKLFEKDSTSFLTLIHIFSIYTYFAVYHSLIL